MTEVLFIRHGPTEWNAEKRIQGRTDIPLSRIGREQTASRALPAEFMHYERICSPLVRARETAELLGLDGVRPEVRLIEMDWGEWEGQLLPELRERGGEEMVRNEARGLDFRPPGGESPRDVQARLADWCGERSGGPGVVAITHKGVIRAALALATGWDMLGRAPQRLDWACGHLFSIEDGGLQLHRPNVSLEMSPEVSNMR